MKTSQLFDVLGLLLFGCSALAPSANAFYNPQRGRWLNRDPINEPSFKVLTYGYGYGSVLTIDN